MDANEAQHAERLRSLQDRWLAIPSVQERRQREGESARIRGAASPTFAEVYAAPCYVWEEWFAIEVARLNG
jgi:hypothetical protein